MWPGQIFQCMVRYFSLQYHLLITMQNILLFYEALTKFSYLTVTLWTGVPSQWSVYLYCLVLSYCTLNHFIWQEVSITTSCLYTQFVQQVIYFTKLKYILAMKIQNKYFICRKMYSVVHNLVRVRIVYCDFYFISQTVSLHFL